MEPKPPPRPENGPITPPEEIRVGWRFLWEGLRRFWRELIDLRAGMDREGCIRNIRENKRMQGANAWLLMCSIMVASLGLDLNSPAVIIGAMLISPLMSPILGVGLAVGINDRRTLLISLRHLLVSIGIALVTSYLYFRLTPFGRVTPEILSRTAPTLLDVMVAFFGGVAGIVSGTRKDKSNALPGVAIATALMPPLCVTGFGLAKGEWDIMLRSFYLFFLNAVFVALATYLVVRYLRFPQVQFADAREKRRTQWGIALFILVLIVPSVLILRGVLRDIGERQQVEAFVKKNFSEAFFQIEDLPGRDTLHAKVFLFRHLPEDSARLFQERFKDMKLRARLDIIQGEPDDAIFNKEQFQRWQQSFRGEMLAVLESERLAQAQKNREVQTLQRQLDSLRSDTVLLRQIAQELEALFPELESLGFARLTKTASDSLLVQVPTFTLKWAPGRSTRQIARDEAQLERFLRIRARLDTLVLLRE